MGQSSNKPIHSNKNQTQSELQLENVDERRKLVEIRSEDLQAYKDLLFKYIEENAVLEDKIKDLMTRIEELKEDNAIMVTQIDNHNALSQLRNNTDVDAPDSGIVRNSIASEYSLTEEKSTCVEVPTEASLDLKSLQLLLTTLNANVERGFKKIDSLVLSDKSSASNSINLPSRPPPPPPPLPPQETTRLPLNIVQRSLSVGGSRQCVGISVHDALIAELKKIRDGKSTLKKVKRTQSNRNLPNMIEREVEPNGEIQLDI